LTSAAGLFERESVALKMSTAVPLPDPEHHPGW